MRHNFALELGVAPALKGAGFAVIPFESLDARIAGLGSHHIELLFRWRPILISPEKQRVAVTPILYDWGERREAAVAARRRANFRIVSISVVAGSIVLIYGVWILWRYIL